MQTYKLHEAISKVCPIDGVCIGVPEDKGTWVVSYSPDATPEQKILAQEVINNWIDPGEDRFVTKVTAYNRISIEYGDAKLEQLFDLLDALPRKDRRIYDDAQDIDCSNIQVIIALQSIGIDPSKILY